MNHSGSGFAGNLIVSPASPRTRAQSGLFGNSALSIPLTRVVVITPENSVFEFASAIVHCEPARIVVAMPHPVYVLAPVWAEDIVDITQLSTNGVNVMISAGASQVRGTATDPVMASLIAGHVAAVQRAFSEYQRPRQIVAYGAASSPASPDVESVIRELQVRGLVMSPGKSKETSTQCDVAPTQPSNRQSRPMMIPDSKKGQGANDEGSAVSAPQQKPRTATATETKSANPAAAEPATKPEPAAPKPAASEPKPKPAAAAPKPAASEPKPKPAAAEPRPATADQKNPPPTSPPTKAAPPSGTSKPPPPPPTASKTPRSPPPAGAARPPPQAAPPARTGTPNGQQVTATPPAKRPPPPPRVA